MYLASGSGASVHQYYPGYKYKISSSTIKWKLELEKENKVYEQFLAQ